MSAQMKQETIDMVQKIDDIPRRDFTQLLPHQMYGEETKHAADLLEKMLEWVPDLRITCEKALKHPFFTKWNK
jgi:serine/threonine protein kinase